MRANDGRIFKIADEGNTRASNITYNASNITKMGDSVGRAYIIGNAHRASEGSD